MCGICGSLSLSRGPVDGVAVEAMLDRLVHRGPDSAGRFAERGIAAGARRLAVIDVEGGAQPIASESGAVQVVFNGAIYNHEELRSELEARGHRFRTRSDTEVLVHLWEDDGPRMVERLNGMFAFCIHDRERGETFLARDRLGIKPLFYALEGDRLAFASEVAALLAHPGVRREVDHAALVEQFCLQFVAGERTVWRGVRKLLPGHALHVAGGRVAIRRYWEVPAEAPAREDPPEVLARELRELLRSAVRYRRIADVPLGVFLSGGIDSSIVALLLAQATDRPVQAFSVGFEEPRYDERAAAREAAARCGAEHHELVLSAVQLGELLPRMVRHLAEPVTDPALIPTYLLAEFARRRVTVALSGEGADELFGGYRRYVYQQRYGWLGRLPGVATGRRATARALPPRIDQALAAMAEGEPARMHAAWAATIGGRTAATLFEGPALAEFDRRVEQAFRPYFPGPRARLADQLRADQQEWLPHDLLAKVDSATMAASLEARVPFLDHRVVEWAARVPERLKVRGRTTKHLLREAFRGRLPETILGGAKRGFDLPLDAWIRGPLRELAGDLLVPARLGRWDGLVPAAARSMLDAHLKGTRDLGLPLFNLLSVMLFLEERPR